MATHFYDLPNTVLRRNKHTHPSLSNPLRFVNAPALFSRAGLLAAESFIYPPLATAGDAMGDVPFTTYIVADLDSDAGLALVKEALDSMVLMFLTFHLHVLSV